MGERKAANEEERNWVRLCHFCTVSSWEVALSYLSYLYTVSPGCGYQLPREGWEWRWGALVSGIWPGKSSLNNGLRTSAASSPNCDLLHAFCVSSKQRHGCVWMCGCAFVLWGQCWGLGTGTCITHTPAGGEQQPSPVCLRFDLFTNQRLSLCRLHSTAQIYLPTCSWVLLPKLESICTPLVLYFRSYINLPHLWAFIEPHFVVSHGFV